MSHRKITIFQKRRFETLSKRTNGWVKVYLNICDTLFTKQKASMYPSNTFHFPRGWRTSFLCLCRKLFTVGLLLLTISLSNRNCARDEAPNQINLLPWSASNYDKLNRLSFSLLFIIHHRFDLNISQKLSSVFFTRVAQNNIDGNYLLLQSFYSNFWTIVLTQRDYRINVFRE